MDKLWKNGVEINNDKYQKNDGKYLSTHSDEAYDEEMRSGSKYTKWFKLE
jgi:hypothetical protein